MKFGLENIKALLDFLGNPQRKFSAIHVAGTNGKGSTASLIAAVLTSAGYKTGLYTSPHLVSFTERIRINGTSVSEKKIVELVKLLHDAIEDSRATFFEATTAIAFRHFADEGVDVAVVEVGLGGRLDATNVLSPVLTIITSIDLEHTEILGSTKARIAHEKGGIIKKGVPCLVGKVGNTEWNVLKSIARKKSAKIIRVSQNRWMKLYRQGLAGLEVKVESRLISASNLYCSLAGKFQMNNMILALSALERLRMQGFSKLRARSVRVGFSHVQHYSGLLGRFEIFSRKPTIILDVAHNPAAMRSLVNSLQQLSFGKMIVIFGVMKDKDLDNMASELASVSRQVIAVAPKTKRAQEPSAIANAFHRMGSRCVVAENVAYGVRLALAEISTGEAILVTGSHYVVGGFLEEMKKNVIST